MCSECGQKVSGEGTGCTAMDKLFHIKCFLCVKCGEYYVMLSVSFLANQLILSVSLDWLTFLDILKVTAQASYLRPLAMLHYTTLQDLIRYLISSPPSPPPPPFGPRNSWPGLVWSPLTLQTPAITDIPHYRQNSDPRQKRLFKQRPKGVGYIDCNLPSRMST